MRVSPPAVSALVATLRDWGYEISDEDLEDLIAEYDVKQGHLAEKFYGEMPIDEAKSLLRVKAKDGVECPVCEQRAQIYRRQIYGNMALHLILAYKRAETEWFHGPTLIPESPGGDDSKLVYWGLIQPRPGERTDGSTRTGWWRVTNKGASFVKGWIKVPKYAYVYNGELLRLDGPLVGINQALGKNFDYSELMNG